jgi:translation initiation factor 2A
MSTQLFYRAPKLVGLLDATPKYADVAAFQQPSQDVRQALYSSNGEFFAYTQPSGVVVTNPDDGSLVCELPIQDAFDLHFSPNGSYLSIWQRPVKEEGGNYANNVTIYDIKNSKTIAHFLAKDQSGWTPSFTADEKIIAKLFKNEVRFYDVNNSSNLSKTWSVLKLEGVSNFQLSPGQKPTIATFVPERSGKPANVSVWNISTSITQPVSSKTFFKAEKCSLKWNSLGTALLALASTDVDASNKSYYGETTLYLLGIAGSYDSRITLDKEGPIHDISWSPTAREFGVSYGFMPAQTSFFDARGNLIYSLPPAPKNTVMFSPHAKYILVAGFGNLQGTVDIYDRTQKFAKVASFDASNTSVCQWSPDGRYILTATTSPRLRVDNGIKIWYATGKLIYNKDFKELNSVQWRPRPLDHFPPLRSLDENPAPHQSAIDYVLTHPKSSPGVQSKPKGAYRPPHARGSSSAAPQTLYQKELSANMNGMAVGYKPPQAKRLPPGMTAPVEKESKSAAKNRKKRENKKINKEGESASEPDQQSQQPQEDSLIAGGVQSIEDKKIRSLLKKLRAIEGLKLKQANNEALEETQVLKIETESKVRQELAQLGWNE